MDEIVPQLNESLILDNSDLIADYLELGIDSIVNNEVLKEIPIVKSIMSINKVTKSIRERNLMKNLVIFLNELNSGNIDKDKLEKHKESLKLNSKKAEEELGRILIILEQVIDNKKSSILGKLYRAYVNQTINWNSFIEYSEITNRLYINDLDTLLLIYNRQLDDTSNRSDLYRIERLNSLGVIGLAPKAIFVSSMGGCRQDSYITLNSIGEKYSSIIFNK